MTAGEGDDLRVGGRGVEEVEREAFEDGLALGMQREVDFHRVLRWTISGSEAADGWKRVGGR